MGNVSGSLHYASHKAEDTSSTAQVKTLKLGYCPNHPDMWIKKRGHLLRQIKERSCPRCDDIHAAQMGKLVNNPSREIPSERVEIAAISSRPQPKNRKVVPPPPPANEKKLRDLLPALSILNSRGQEFTLINRTDSEMFGLYYILPHNSKYQIQLVNPFICKCRCNVSIDGYDMGTWQLTSKQVAAIERPANAAKLFTFLRTKYAVLAEEAARILASNPDRSRLTEDQRRALDVTPSGSGVTSGREENGLVVVTYAPERNKSTIRLKAVQGVFAEQTFPVDIFTTGKVIYDYVLRYAQGVVRDRLEVSVCSTKLTPDTPLYPLLDGDGWVSYLSMKSMQKADHKSLYVVTSMCGREFVDCMPNDTLADVEMLLVFFKGLKKGGYFYYKGKHLPSRSTRLGEIGFPNLNSEQFFYTMTNAVPHEYMGPAGGACRSGATTLQGDSDQRFGKVASIPTDDARTVVQEVRLVVDADEDYEVCRVAYTAGARGGAPVALSAVAGRALRED